MAKTNIGPRINVSACDFYNATFGSPNRGAQCILEWFPLVYAESLKELRGIFTSNELSTLVVAADAVGLNDSPVHGQLLRALVSKEAGLDNYIAGVVPEVLAAKIQQLSPWQAVCLALWTRLVCSAESDGAYIKLYQELGIEDDEPEAVAAEGAA